MKLVNKKNNTGWYLYIVCCNDKSLYTGVTNDLKKRITKHNSGKGAKYTASRRPVVLKYTELHQTKSDALKRERQIKNLTRQEKINLINSSSHVAAGFLLTSNLM